MLRRITPIVCAVALTFPAVVGCESDGGNGNGDGGGGGSAGSGGMAGTGGMAGGGGTPGVFTNEGMNNGANFEYGCSAVGNDFGFEIILTLRPMGGDTGCLEIEFSGAALVSEAFIQGAEAVLGDLTMADVQGASLPVAAISGASGANTVLDVEMITIDLDSDPDGNGVPGPFEIPVIPASGTYEAPTGSTEACFNYVADMLLGVNVTFIGSSGMEGTIPVTFTCQPANQDDLQLDPAVITPEETAGQVCVPVTGMDGACGTGGMGGMGGSAGTGGMGGMAGSAGMGGSAGSAGMGGMGGMVPTGTIGSGSGSTSWQALPKVATSGSCVYDSTTTTCSGCVSSGTDAPGGGDCAAFGAQEFQGCEVPGGVLNSQLAIDVTIALEIASDGAGNITHDFTVTAVNGALVPAAGLVNVDAATLFARATSGMPGQLSNALNPALAGQPLGAFTNGTNTLILDDDAATGAGEEIPTVVTAVTPTSSPNIEFNYDTFSLTLTIVATGAPLTVDDGGCVFDIPGNAISLPVVP